MGDNSEVLLLAAHCNIPYKHIRRNVRRASARKFQQNRWKLRATMMSLLLAMYCHNTIRALKQLWALPRSSNWLENIVLNNFGLHDWMQNFRMSRESFYYLCNQLRSLLEK